jgi:RHS repeat-associated protein
LNEYTAVGPQPLTYDDSGNLRESAEHELVYDCRNLLTAITDKATGQSVEFLHDARGRRVAELRAGIVTHLIPDDVNLIEEYENGTPVRQYIHTGEVDSCCQVAQNGMELWCHIDQFGSPRVLTGPGGTAAGTASYDPFGVPGTRTGIAVPIGFAGRRFDEAFGMYDFRSREYAPALGRFLQRDSLGMTVAANLYQYALDNPLRYIDPFGTEPGWLRKTLSRFVGGAWGALKNFGGFLRMGLWDSWAQTFSSSSRERIEAAQQWFGELYDAVDEGRFLAWTGEGLGARMNAIVEAEERGDYFGSGEIFGDTAFTGYGVASGGIGFVRGGLRFGSNLRAYGVLETTKGIGYGLRHWATTYRGLGLTRGSIAEAQFGTVRGSPYANYETYLGTREISRMTWQAEQSIARGGNNDIRSVRTYRRFTGTNAAPRFYGTAVNRVVDQALRGSSDPFLSTDIIRQGRFGRNAKGNPIMPDYRISIDNQTVIDITTVKQAGKAGIYPAANAIEPYTGTVRHPGVPLPPTPRSPPEEGPESSDQ